MTCECGCGQETPIATRSSTAKGWRKGEPLRFVHGHNRRRYHGIPDTTWCRTCETELAAAAFYRDASRPTGLSSECRECRKARARARHAADPATTLERMRTWRARNPGRQTRLAADYDARKRAAFVERIDRSVVWRRDRGVCGICGWFADEETFQVDHIQPLAHGGLDSYENVQVAHPVCNQRKHAS